MAKQALQAATRGREDVSRFIVHLTRDDRKTFKNGSTARDNLISILKARKLLATKAHCLHNTKIAHLPEKHRKRLAVVCFTEVPLNQLHLIVREIPGRNTCLAPYGVVFTKDFIAKTGGQPAIYINSYNQNLWLREAVDELFKQSQKDEEFDGKLWRFLPFLNAKHEKYDFSWEREWRVRGNFNFTLDDIACVVLPEDDEDELKEKCAKRGIAVISPAWTYEQIVGELARQQRTTKRLTLSGSETKSKTPA